MLASLLRIAPPGAPVDRWHVSPLVDSLAYHWSWLLALIPMGLLGSEREDYLFLFLLVLVMNFAHRHLTLPIVYLDREVLRTHPLRFTVVPVLMVSLFLVEPLLRDDPDTRLVFLGIASFSGAWGLYHTIQQKYGMLRLYNVKSQVPLAERPPAWVDRLLCHGWWLAWTIYLGTTFRPLVESAFNRATPFMNPVLDRLWEIRPWALPLGIAIGVASVAIFLWYEWRNERFGNLARLNMGIGTALLSACLLVFDPAKVFLAYTFSHALEYFVFVWAYERKRFADPASPASLLKRLTRHPAVFYLGFLVAVGGFYVVMRYYGDVIYPDERRLRFAGITGSHWIYFWGISQSMVHFYYDGFLWKMRSPTTRANL